MPICSTGSNCKEGESMKYNFSDIINRTGKDALALDGVGTIPGISPGKPKAGFDFIPMWVADMNFATAPAVTAALQERLQHPLYGYFIPSPDYYHAIIRWHHQRNGVTGLQRRYIGYENSVIGGMLQALKVFCSPGDAVLIHAPTYIHFTDGLQDNGYRMIASPLVKDREGIWRMDYGDMERKIRKYRIHAAIFCSPHNPTGRVWELDELQQMMELFRKHNVFVISDEIWSDIILGNNHHIPLQSVSADARERTVALYALTKTFNLAGIGGAYHIIYNRMLRERIVGENKKTYGTELNVLAMHALIGAYSPEGQEWTEELCQVLTQNVAFACAYISRHFDGVQLSAPQGTYMLFLDVHEWLRRHGVPLRELLLRGVRCGVIWQDGEAFIYPDSIRMNLALPLSQLQEAMERLKKYAFK